MTPEQINTIVGQEGQLRSDKMKVTDMLRVAGAEDRQFGLDKFKTAATLMQSGEETNLKKAQYLLDEEKAATNKKYLEGLSKYNEGLLDIKGLEKELAYEKRVLELEKFLHQQTKDLTSLQKNNTEIALNGEKLKAIETLKVNPNDPSALAILGRSGPSESVARLKDLDETKIGAVIEETGPKAANMEQKRAFIDHLRKFYPNTNYGYFVDERLFGDKPVKVDLPPGMTMKRVEELAIAKGKTVDQMLKEQHEYNLKAKK